MKERIDQLGISSSDRQSVRHIVIKILYDFRFLYHQKLIQCLNRRVAYGLTEMAIECLFSQVSTPKKSSHNLPDDLRIVINTIIHPSLNKLSFYCSYQASSLKSITYNIVNPHTFVLKREKQKQLQFRRCHKGFTRESQKGCRVTSTIRTIRVTEKAEFQEAGCPINKRREGFTSGKFNKTAIIVKKNDRPMAPVDR